MKYPSIPTFLVFVLLIIGTSACRSDDDGSNSLFFELRHDGDNVTAPLLPEGYTELAARFTRDDVNEVLGGQLERIQVFFSSIPQQVELIVYGEGNANTPGQELYFENVTGRVTTTGLQEFRLSSPITITDQEIWLSVGVLAGSNNERAVGCDAGPTQTGGDHIFFSTAANWNTFRNASGGESVNWNIRGIVRRPEQ